MVHRFRGSYLMKLIMSHLMLVCVILAAGSGILLNRTAAMMDEEMEQSGASQLSALQERLERQELDKYSARVLNNALSMVREEAEGDIQSLLEDGKTEHYYQIINRFAQDLKTLYISLPSLHNLSYYFKKDDFLVDRYFYEFPAASPQAELLASEHLPLHRWFLRTIPAPAGAGTGSLQVLTYVNTLPYMAEDEQIKGYMIVDLDPSKLIGNLGDHLADRNEKLAVLGANGQIIGASSSWDSALIGQLQEQLARADYRMLKNGDQVVSLLPPSESALGWNYVLLREQNEVILTTEKMRRDIGLAAGAIFILGVALAYMVSRWCYSTFRYVTQKVRALTGHFMPSGLVSEVGWLDQAFRRLDQQQMQRQLLELIQGSAAYGEEELSIPEGNSYLAVSVELHGIDLAAFAEAFRQALPESHLQGECLPAKTGEAVIVYWSDHTEALRMEQAVIRHLKETENRIEAPFRYGAGLGGAVSAPEELHLSAAEAETARRYAFFYEDSAAITYRDIEARRDYFIKLKPEQLDNLLKAGSPAELERFLAECEAGLRNEPYAIEAVELVLMQLHLSVSNARMMLEGNGEACAYVRGATLGECFARLKEAALAVTLDRLEKRNDRRERVLAAIRSYMEEHLHEEISLDTLTEMTSYSKQYICRLFKEEMQTTFVDYLTLLRLEHAARLLRGTEESAVRIAERSGFGSSQYFSRKFKAYYGVTPVQYRQAEGQIQIVPNSFKMNN